MKAADLKSPFGPYTKVQPVWEVKFPVKTLRDMPAYKFWRSPDVVQFVKRIAENPDDDLPRLVFCDWLEDTAGGELDQLHSQYIRESIADADPKSYPRVFDRPVPGPLKERVYAGYNSAELVNGSALLGPPHFVAHVDRGFLSRVEFITNDINLRNMTDHLTPRVGFIRYAMFGGPLKSALYHYTDTPIAMFHPYWLELDDPDPLELNTFRGVRQVNESGVVVRAEYLGFTHYFRRDDLLPIGDGVKAGEHVIRETIQVHWQGVFSQLGWPVAVRLSAKLVEYIAERTRQLNPL